MRVLQAGVEGRSLTGAELEYAQETERRTGRKATGVFVPMSALETRVNTTGSAGALVPTEHRPQDRSEEHTSELQSLMRISYAVFCLKKKNLKYTQNNEIK